MDRLIDLAELGEREVTKVDHPVHGELAVGVNDGVPFAVSGRCRHLRGPLGEGRVVDGLLECPWHGARYDVHTGRMAAGPRGVFRPLGVSRCSRTGRAPTPNRRRAEAPP